MASIKISQKAKGSSATVFKKLRTYCDKKLILKEVGNLKPRVKWEKGKQVGHFKEKGVAGVIKVSTHSPCKITVTMEIPFLMIPFKGILKNSIQSHLDKFA